MIKPVSLTWQNGLKVDDENYPEFIRSDTVSISGFVQADSASLSAKVTVSKIIESIPVVAWSLTSDVSGGIVLSATSLNMSSIVITLVDKTRTSQFDPGTSFVFDIELETTAERLTIKSGFSIAEDYTLN